MIDITCENKHCSAYQQKAQGKVRKEKDSQLHKVVCKSCGHMVKFISQEHLEKQARQRLKYARLAKRLALAMGVDTKELTKQKVKTILDELSNPQPPGQPVSARELLYQQAAGQDSSGKVTYKVRVIYESSGDIPEQSTGKGE